MNTTKRTCYAYAYADADGVSVNLFSTMAERDHAVRELLDDLNGEGNVFAADASAEEAWDAVCEDQPPDFHLAFNEI